MDPFLNGDRPAKFGQKRDSDGVDVPNSLVAGDEWEGQMMGIVVTGSHSGHVSVCSVSRGLSTGKSDLLEYEEVVPSRIVSICQISGSVVCLACMSNCYFYDFIQNERLFTLEGHLVEVKSVTWYPERSLLCSGGRDRTIRLWRVDRNEYSQSKEIHQLKGHADYVYCVRSREEIWPNRLLSSSLDTTGRVWDLTTQQQIAVLGRHTESVYGIDLSSNGDYLVTGSLDWTVRLWDTNVFEKQTTVEVGETVYSLFCAQKRPNTIVVGAVDHVFIYDPRNLSNGPANTWEGGEKFGQIVEVDSNRFVHRRGQIFRNYNGEILTEWDIRPGYGVCYVEFDKDEETSAIAEESLMYAAESCCFSGVIVLRNSVQQLGCWRCLLHPLD